MSWQTILKQPKLRTGSKITTNLGTDSKLEDNDCLKKVLEYLEKMRNFGEVYNQPTIEFDGWITKDSTDFGYFHMMEPFTCGGRKKRNSFLCNEKVACVVLKLLERLKSQGSGMFEEDVIDGDKVYLVEIKLESTKNLKHGKVYWFDDHQDASFIIVISGLSNVDSLEYYQITYESHPKNPNRTATGYKDYSEDDYKRMIKVLHKGVFG